MKRYRIPILIVSTFISWSMLGCNSVPPSVAEPSQESSPLAASTFAEYEQQISDLEQQVSSLTKRVSDLEETVGSLESKVIGPLENKVKLYSIEVKELENIVDEEVTQLREQQVELGERIKELAGE